MKSNKAYSVFFTVVLCWACAGILTFAHTRWRTRIEENESYARIHAVMDALGLAMPGADRDEVLAAYRSAVRVRTEGEMQVFEAREGDRVMGYALHLAGRGRYGPIQGVLAVDASRQRIIGLRIYRHNETPGLGGRIASIEWLGQFAGKPLVTDGVSGIVIGARERGGNTVDGITGASKTTFALSRMLNQAIAELLAGGMKLEELDLGLGVDAVTRATPGYPKTRSRPPHLRKEIRRPPFMTVPGMDNLALGKPVTGSMTEEPIIGELDQVTDGVKKSGDFDYVELDFGPQWVQIDLGETRSIHAIVIWHYYKNPVIYNDVIVQVADDECFETGVRTLFNNDHDDSSGLGKGADTAYHARWWGEIVDARGDANAGTRARFVRVYTNGGAAEEETRFVEIAVYGK